MNGFCVDVLTSADPLIPTTEVLRMGDEHETPEYPHGQANDHEILKDPPPVGARGPELTSMEYVRPPPNPVTSIRDGPKRGVPVGSMQRIMELLKGGATSLLLANGVRAAAKGDAHEL